ncbi:hypothetical protein PILCRDRAFT_10597 [Piloderma croceum F 1598]|uniref:CxC2-like cysteine cluster KDZ transposase-associated domain-containing protein n=1 Tax=Piloderma croceum (strain F 1598) TaxID=765440 RepID=A0A0C3AYV8_PILCF|nr:hypothetical protein PILCRDRAFT_10597 [Piloderma croceum F 1598]
MSDVLDRYDEFLRMIHEWRHLKMLKCAGHGHDSACSLQKKKVSSEEADPTLSPGWSYYTEVTKYNDHLATGVEEEVRSTCVNHHAMKDTNTRRSENLASTGIGTIDCIQHNMKQPCSIGDLQKGENISHSNFISLTMSYDIVCQWHLHLWEHMSSFPEHLHINIKNKQVTFLVPKFHLPAHVKKCQTAFSFNLTRGVGRTDGEAPKRGWSDINPLSSQTKQMGPASHQETVDDHFGDWNHKKVVGLGAGLLCKLKNAMPEHAEHVWDFMEFSETLPATEVSEWTEMVERWEEDNTEINPFHGVRLALAEEDAADLRRENALPIHDDITPTMLISSGLEIESQQIRLKHTHSKLDSLATMLQLAKMQE